MSIYEYYEDQIAQWACHGLLQPIQHPEKCARIDVIYFLIQQPFLEHQQPTVIIIIITLISSKQNIEWKKDCFILMNFNYSDNNNIVMDVV